MPDRIDEMGHEEFVTYLQIPGLMTDEEIAGKVRTYYPSATPRERVDLAQAILALKGTGGVTGTLRTALRSLDDLPPLEGD